MFIEIIIQSAYFARHVELCHWSSLHPVFILIRRKLIFQWPSGRIPQQLLLIVELPVPFEWEGLCAIKWMAISWTLEITYDLPSSDSYCCFLNIDFMFWKSAWLCLIKRLPTKLTTISRLKDVDFIVRLVGMRIGPMPLQFNMVRGSFPRVHVH